jgi:hypothetical protein
MLTQVNPTRDLDLNQDLSFALDWPPSWVLKL